MNDVPETTDPDVTDPPADPVAEASDAPVKSEGADSAEVVPVDLGSLPSVDSGKTLVGPKQVAASPTGGDVPAGDLPLDEAMYWYVLKVQSNREKSIRENLVRRIKREGLEAFFGEIVIPTETVVENKSGKKKTFERKLYPGYIMIHMILNDETWFLVRETSGVGDFTGAAGKPIPMQDHEIQRMIGQKTPVVIEGDKPVAQKIKIDVSPGETVKIKEGMFENFEGTIESIDENTGKVSVLIEIFGRSTPVELESWQVEAV